MKYKSHVGMVVHPFGEKTPAGLGRAMFEIARAVIEEDKSRFYTIFVKQELEDKPKISGDNWEVISLHTHRTWQPFILDSYKKDIDIWFFFSPVIPLFFKPKKSLVIAWDFAYLYFKDKGLKAWLHRKFLYIMQSLAFKKASYICSISDFTKTEVSRFFSVLDKKNISIPVSYIPVCYGKTNYPKLSSLPESYVLFIGAIKERKNVLRIVQAYELSESRKNGVRLVIAGTGRWSYFETVVAYVKDNNLEKDIIFTGYVSEVDLPSLYQHANAIIYPSLLEGFGMPILEAFDCDTHVVTSNIGSLAEVAGAAAMCVDPYSVVSIQEGMDKLLTDETYRKELLNKRKERLEIYSWKKTAKGYVEVLGKMQI